MIRLNAYSCGKQLCPCCFGTGKGKSPVLSHDLISNHIPPELPCNYMDMHNLRHVKFCDTPDELPNVKALGLLASQASSYTKYHTIPMQRNKPPQDSSLSVPERRTARYIPEPKHLSFLPALPKFCDLITGY